MYTKTVCQKWEGLKRFCLNVGADHYRSRDNNLLLKKIKGQH